MTGSIGEAGSPPTDPVVLSIGETMMAIASQGRDGHTPPMRPAGAESNVAANLAGLGHRAAWASRVGTDALGARVLAWLEARGVDVSLVVQDPEHRTGLMVKEITPAGTRVTYYREHSAASYLSPADIGRFAAVGANVVHMTGVTPALSVDCEALTSAIITGRALGPDCLVSFDVNFRPPLWPEPARAAPLLALLANAADVVFVGLDEACSLWNCRQPKDVRDILPRPGHVVVKDGPRNATEFGADGSCRSVPARRAQVLEPVGAGDAFAAGWIGAHLWGGDVQQRLSLGHLLASTALATTADVGNPPERSDVDIAWQGSSSPTRIRPVPRRRTPEYAGRTDDPSTERMPRRSGTNEGRT